MLTLPDQRGFVQCDSEDLPTSGVYTAALTIVKANEKFVADLIVVKEYGSAYAMRGFGKCTFKDRPVNCGKSALRLAYCVGIFLRATTRPQLSAATATSPNIVSIWTMRPAPR